MNIKLIKTEEDYQTALKRLDEIFDAPMEHLRATKPMS